jgi:hypothetical protein
MARAATPDATGYDALLAKYLVSGADGVARVRYAAWKASAADRATLAAYVTALAAAKPSTLARADAFALWANLYNALTLQVVLDRYPVRSIRDIKSEGAGLDPKALFGPWRTKRVTVEGKRLSLDDIEHGIMRPSFKDPRVHYAVNCASIGCPNLKATAWRAASLEADLDAAARAYVNSPRGAVALNPGLIRASSIYDWFKADFGGNDAGVLSHLRRYADKDLEAALTAQARIAGFSYDWALNDAAPTGKNT